MAEDVAPLGSDDDSADEDAQKGSVAESSATQHLTQNNFYLQASVISEVAEIRESAPELYNAYVDGFKRWNATLEEDTREQRRLTFKFLRAGQNKAVLVTLVIFGLAAALAFDGRTVVAGLMIGAGALFGVANIVRAFTGASAVPGGPEQDS